MASLTIAQIILPPKLVDMFTGEARYRVAYGGRGSAKTRSFALMTAVRGYMWSMQDEAGIIVCAREHLNSLDESSMAEIKAAIRSEPWLEAHYDIGEKFIRTKDGLIEYAFIGLRHNLDSIKSKARIRLLWVDEAEPVSETAWAKAVPSVREDDSEIWITYNPERKTSATHKRFRAGLAHDPDAKVVEINYRDNPFFPRVLELERERDERERPDSYAHIWEGDFVSVVEGAYFASDLLKAKKEGRIGRIAPDPLMTIRAAWDIGGTGAKADACAIWIYQVIGREIRIVNHYEQQGQPLAAHIAWLRQNGYGEALCVLPHDGSTNDKVYDVSFESALKAAGFNVIVVPNQGKGAAKARIEAARRLFSQMWFNEDTTEGGRDALGWYHEHRDDKREIGLGPKHDWSSHSADAFGLIAVSYEAPRQAQKIDMSRVGLGVR